MKIIKFISFLFKKKENETEEIENYKIIKLENDYYGKVKFAAKKRKAKNGISENRE